MNTDEVIHLIYDTVNRLGSQKALAFRMRISEQYLSDVLNRRREPGAMILKYFKLTRVISYLKEQ